ncbi:uncharacterized protein LOC106874202 [Octopus bimaculoides]|uniref:Uncharacterized protein n=1 Tax=Octopus bimaculoides TaxID=37653 RepID=A0A0L8GXD4_OCTBM|nr:uncharacterized protein LOC106874202 [Octopus bimaculoides]|eukprot:XP_014777344.1 PREDICTED: uncharacterized protein LOC106874202 [Octopus bimaculoides]
MSSKKERRTILASIWSQPTVHELDFFDKGKYLVVTSTYKDIIKWWMNVLKVFYPQETYREKGDLIKLKPVSGVTLRLNKTSGVMRIEGKNHWVWFVDNFANILEQGNVDAESLAEQSDTSVTRYLHLDKNLDEVQEFIDMIPEGGGIMCHDFILQLWKCLLDDWFGVGATVYIVTPQIDPERVFSIYLLMIRNKGTGFNVTLLTPEKGPDRFSKVLDIAKQLMKKTRTSRHTLLVSDVKREWVTNKLTIRHEEFSTNFIAAYKDHEAEVLTTTAYFHKSHFNFNLKDTVTYNKLPTSELRRNYLLPLGFGERNF